MDDSDSTTFNANDLDDAEEGSFYCEICDEKLQMSQHLFARYQGHFFCKDCYEQEYYKGKEAKCPRFACPAWIDHAQDSSKLKAPENAEISNKMFPHPISPNSSTSFAKLGHTYSSASLSKRPLFCPLRHCNKAIAVKSVDYHFEYEHKHVATITTHLETRNGMEFRADDIKPDDILCICLIKLKKPEDCEITSTVNNETITVGPTVSETPILLIMATRITFEDAERTYGEDFCDCLPCEQYFIWVSSNLSTNFNYTLALSSQCNILKVKYFGPLMTLNEDFRMLCMQSKGLVLTEERVRGMTGEFQRPLVLDLLIHGPRRT